MSNRVLLVDDDPMLLSSMERCLGEEFDLTTATSGAEGLRQIDENPAFGVLLSDMRMPAMDGVEFLQLAAERSPDSVLMMLTGNQDGQTAARAVNEGHVDRFLNKPCDPREIAEALRDGLKRYDARTAEAETLDKTLTGVMDLLTAVVGAVRPDRLERADHCSAWFERLREQLGAPPRWEYQTAAKLCLLGYVLASEQRTDDLIAALDETSEEVAEMVGRLPRLERVAAIFRTAPTSVGQLDAEPVGSGDEVVTVGATLLRLAQLCEALRLAGVNQERAIEALREQMPRLSDETLNLVAAACESATLASEPSPRGVELAWGELLPVMVLQADIEDGNGRLLVAAGRRLTLSDIDELRRTAGATVGAAQTLVTPDSYAAARKAAAASV